MRDFALTGGTAWFQGKDVRTSEELSLLGNAANLCSLNNGEGDYNLIPLLEELDVKASADTYAVMFIGDSTITNSIPDMLLDNLQRNGIHNVSVVSSAIKGNELLQDGAGEKQGPLEGKALITRFQHDALEVAGVQKIFVKIGTNDILHPQLSDLKDWYNGSSTRPDGYTPTAEQMIGGYQNLIDQAKAAGKELYFMDINPFIGYTRDGSLTWTKDFADQVNPIRLAVNAWLADNQSQYAGYIPCTAKIGEDVTIGGTVYPLGQIAKRYTTDWVHPSPAGMQAEADLIPITYSRQCPLRRRIRRRSRTSGSPRTRCPRTASGSLPATPAKTSRMRPVSRAPCICWRRISSTRTKSTPRITQVVACLMRRADIMAMQ